MMVDIRDLFLHRPHRQRGQRARIENQFHQRANDIKPAGANKAHPAAFAVTGS
jgi:hypothetical protein